MKAIVTGATGGLGRNLCQRLEQEGWQVIALGRNKNIGQQLASKQTEFRSVELTQRDSVRGALESADVIFHCAALSSPWGKYEDFYASNVLATEYLLERAEQLTIPRFVHVSTTSVYFDFKDRIDVSEDEELPIEFANHYAKTKFLAEEVIRKHSSKNMTKVILRPRGIFGEYDKALVPRLMRVARKGRFPLINGGNALVDVTYVQNVVHAMFLASTKDLPEYSLFNISNGEPWEVEQLVEVLTKKLNIPCRFLSISDKKIMFIASMLECLGRIGIIKEPPLTRYTAGLLAYSQTMNINKAKEQLGYEPIYSVEQGIDRYVDWYNNTL